MERIPDLVESVIAPPFFQASSIADIKDSREQIVEANLEKIQRLPLPMQSLINLSLLFYKSATKLKGREYVFPSAAVIYLPVVRHDPVKDVDPTHRFITISDITGEMQLDFPTLAFLKILRNSGANIDPDFLRKHSWASDVVLSYAVRSYGDSAFLLNVINTFVKDRERESILDFVRGLGGVRLNPGFLPR